MSIEHEKAIEESRAEAEMLVKKTLKELIEKFKGLSSLPAIVEDSKGKKWFFQAENLTASDSDMKKAGIEGKYPDNCKFIKVGSVQKENEGEEGEYVENYYIGERYDQKGNANYTFTDSRGQTKIDEKTGEKHFGTVVASLNYPEHRTEREPDRKANFPLERKLLANTPAEIENFENLIRSIEEAQKKE